MKLLVFIVAAMLTLGFAHAQQYLAGSWESRINNVDDEELRACHYFTMREMIGQASEPNELLFSVVFDREPTRSVTLDRYVTWQFWGVQAWFSTEGFGFPPSHEFSSVQDMVLNCNLDIKERRVLELEIVLGLNEDYPIGVVGPNPILQSETGRFSKVEPRVIQIANQIHEGRY